MNGSRVILIAYVLSAGIASVGFASQGEGASPELVSIRLLMGRGIYAEALEKCKLLLKSRHNSVELYDLLVETGQYASRLPEVSAYLEGRIYQGVEVAEAVYSLGQVALRKRDWTRALQLLDRAIELGMRNPSVRAAHEYAYEKTHGMDKTIDYFVALSHLESRDAGIWYALALAYWGLPDPEKSIWAVQEAIKICPTEPRYRQLLIGATCVWSLSAESRVVAMREVRAALYGRDLEGAEFIRWCVIDALQTVGKWDSAMVIASDAYKSVGALGQLKWRAHLHLLFARSQLSLGMIGPALAHADSAIKFFTLIEDTDGWLSGRTLKVGILRESGNVRAAIRDCLQMFSELSSESDPRLLGGAFIDAAWTFSDMGAINLALAMGIEAQRILQRCSYAVYDHVRMNTALGMLHQLGGNLDLAIRYQKIALDLSKGPSGTRQSIATCSGKLACAFLLQGDTAAALRLIKDQLRIAREIDNPGEEKDALLTLGEIYLERRAHTKAKDRLQDALAIAKRQGDHRTMQRCYMALGMVAERQRDLSRAREYVSLAAAHLPAHRDIRFHMLLSDQTRDKYVSQSRALVHALCRVGRPLTALSIVERLRRDMSLDMLAYRGSRSRGEALSVGSTSQDPLMLLMQERTAIARSLESQQVVWSVLLPSLTRFVSNADTLQSRHLSNDVVAWNEEENGELAASHLRRALNIHKEDVFLTYWVGESITEGFGLTVDTIAHVPIPVTKAELVKLVARSHDFPPILACAENSGETAAQSAQARDCWRLSDLLLGRFENLLREKRRIVVVADAPVSNLAFEMLAIADSNQRRSLVERFAISYASTVFIYDTSQTRSLRPPNVLVFADPMMGGQQSDMVQLVSQVRTGLMATSYRLGLPAALREAEAVKAVFGDRCAVRVGLAATKSELISMSPQYRILHIAAHSQARIDNKEEKGIFLAPDVGNDGYLRSSEIAELKLECDLVVLSGCEAGLQSHAEDWNSLARAFAEAGAGSVIAADHRIDDALTDNLFEYFYLRLRAGESIGEALRMAKTSLIQQGFSDSRFWAGFRLHGRDKPIWEASDDTKSDCWSSGRMTTVAVLLLVVGLVLSWQRILKHR